MTKISHLTYSTDSQSKVDHLNTRFTQEQCRWINDINLPTRIYLTSATEFDDQFLYLNENEWRFRYSGKYNAILFKNGNNFKQLNAYEVKLLKYLTVKYIQENSAGVAENFAYYVARTVLEVDVITRNELINQLHTIVENPNRKSSHNQQFYFTLHALRTLERCGFFESTDEKADLEDLLLDVPRPRNENWGVYQNLDNVIPDEVCGMIENGIFLWSTKLCPKLNTKEEKIAHFERLKKRVDIDAVLDCIITGITYYTGARPVQISKFSAGDCMIDTENKYGMRYSMLIPYAKKAKLAIDRVRVAIPEELGKLIMLYKYLANIGDEEQLFPTTKATQILVNSAISNTLLKFSSKEIQKAVQNGDHTLPVYTSSLFRHNVGHSMAMNGASAAEIAYILGQSTLVVAERYIAATPEMADIREAALGRNPVFTNMIALMLTGNLIQSSEWKGRRVAASIGGKLHYHLGGCSYEENMCPFAQGRACYGCLYFKPFDNGKHIEVLDSLNDEIAEVRNIADDSGLTNHPLLRELIRRKRHVIQVMARVQLFIDKVEVN
ncbi:MULTISPECIES: site-specific integrase [Vibrio]|uniref:site-specific integrase n=1 Tax=Vibrio TaxID=662 RepID=UPI001A201F36|nr:MULTISPECIES: site-specific integrase [Vibrio]MDF4459166.1 site-specific integrase [Vibrio parahaemolyticus]EGR0196977.1 site-specific integrase [Vibrio alginolyticus]ELA9460129.1 site-specific integrase [Vibrio alginolyticus]MBS9847207.1 site-specific integrase [Vibrio alginolyticus]MDF4462622.1 site-specific integrase [Vibrio parahaemolyticus]